MLLVLSEPYLKENAVEHQQRRNVHKSVVKLKIFMLLFRYCSSSKINKANDQKQESISQRKLIQNNLDVYLLQPKGNDLEQLFIDLTTAQ